MTTVAELLNGCDDSVMLFDGLVHVIASVAERTAPLATFTDWLPAVSEAEVMACEGIASRERRIAAAVRAYAAARDPRQPPHDSALPPPEPVAPLVKAVLDHAAALIAAYRAACDQSGAAWDQAKQAVWTGNAIELPCGTIEAAARGRAP